MNKEKTETEKKPIDFKKIFEKADKTILFISITLLLIGVVFVFSASYYVAEGFEVKPAYFFVKQLLWAVASIMAIVFFMFFDYKEIKKYVKPLVLITVGLLLLVFIPGIGHSSGGAQRWIDFRVFIFNPSELAKITVVIYLSYILTKKQSKLSDFAFGILPPLLLVATVFFIILMQSGFSTSVILLFTAFLMFFVGGASMKHIFSILILSAPVLVFFIVKVAYRLDRIFAYLNPWEDPSGKGYHLIQSLKAFANGGFAGRGLGNSLQKVRRLPTPHTDFIYSIIAEEMGVIGSFLVLALFFLLFIKGAWLSLRTKDQFGRLLSFGIVSLITIHAILNTGIATGLFPPTGVSLPFISYGGSSMLMMSIGVGILLNISAQSKGDNRVGFRDIERIVQDSV